jgi:RNA polymerase sigma-70 factor (ECF subfamily)
LDDGSHFSRSDAEEVAQDALLNALRSLDSYRGEAAFSTWLYAITVNICRNYLRKRRRQERVQWLYQGLVELFEDSPKTEESYVSQETRSNLFEAVNALDEKHRLPVILRYYHEYSILEIAQILDVPEGTVHSRLNNARNQLRLSLQKDESKETDV